MLRLLKCEFLKFKRTKIFSLSMLVAFVFPVFNAMLSKANFESIQSGVREDTGFLLLMPLLIILAANLFFAEEDNDTLKNLLCIPISKKQLVFVKLLVLLIFSVGFQIVGFAVGTLIAAYQDIQLTDFALQFALTASTGVLLWAAALPCIVLVVWLNKSYILSVIIVFFYTLLNYVMHFSDAVMMQPLGFNVGTLMPIPMIFRWLYQFHIPDSKTIIDFYNRFSQYFASTWECFCILLIEAIICTFLMIRIYQHGEN